MALVQCRECGKEMSSEAAACPACGAPAKRAGGFGRGLMVVVGVVAGAFVLLLILGAILTYETPPAVRDAESKERAAIELCRKEQDDELKDLAQRRFIRSACDKMASDFKSQYGVDP